MNRLLLLQARRDRLTLTVWVLGVAFLLFVTAQSAHAEYGTSAGRRQVLTLALATPALLALRGIPDGDSLGSAMHFQSYAFLAVAVGLMNTFLATRHGRADEAAGRRELLDATPVGRLAAPVATLLLAVAANTVFGLLAVAGYASAGLPLAGGVLSAAGLALTGLGCFGIGLIAGEIMPTSRGANGLGVTLVLLAYALRAAGDALGAPNAAALTLRPAGISAFSPIGWGQQLLPFTRANLWPLPALTAFAVVTVALGLAVHLRREPGASVVPTRSGSPTGGATLRGPFGLAWRLQWPSLVGWTVGAAALGGLAPSLLAAVSKQRVDDATIRGLAAMLGHSDGGLSSALLATILVLVGILAAAAGVQAMLRARDEEASGRAEAVLAGAVSRRRWLLSWLGMAVLTVVVVLLATAGAFAVATITQGRPVGDAVAQTLVQAPSALALTALAAVLVGVLPRIAIAGSWIAFGVAVAVGLFGEAMRLPHRLVELTPVGSVPALPTGDWGPTTFVGVAAVALAALAVVGIGRRQIAA